MAEYIFEIKAYASISCGEIPVILPKELLHDEKILRPGYHRFVVDMKEKEMEDLSEKLSRVNDLKIIGIDTI